MKLCEWAKKKNHLLWIDYMIELTESDLVKISLSFEGLACQMTVIIGNCSSLPGENPSVHVETNIVYLWSSSPNFRAGYKNPWDSNKWFQPIHPWELNQYMLPYIEPLTSSHGFAIFPSVSLSLSCRCCVYVQDKTWPCVIHFNRCCLTPLSAPRPARICLFLCTEWLEYQTGHVW